MGKIREDGEKMDKILWKVNFPVLEIRLVFVNILNGKIELLFVDGGNTILRWQSSEQTIKYLNGLPLSNCTRSFDFYVNLPTDSLSDLNC